MDCQQIKLKVSDVLDGHIVEAERKQVLAHMEHCPDCASRFGQQQGIRHALRNLPPRPVPADLAMNLRVAASREASHRRLSHQVGGWFQVQQQTLSLFFNNLMRPLAIPFAGGLCSAVLLFSMVMTNFRDIVVAHADDVPTILFTTASVTHSSLPFEFDAENVMLDVYVDGQGRVVDYSFPAGYGSLTSGTERRLLENALLFTQFAPATTFGQPTAGWVRLSFRRSHIDVKG
jgi:hypothetical protein